MVAHVVLFTPRPDLSSADRETFVAALDAALSNIPSIARSRVGRRVRMGREYDAMAGAGFEYAAVLEFDSPDRLREYLDHPAHEALGRLFYQSAASALALDFEIVDGAAVRTVAGWT